MLYFIFYRFAMNSKSGLVYMWISFEMVINIIMTILYGYVYLSIFTAFLLGISEDPSAFILCTVYILGLQLFQLGLDSLWSLTYFYHNCLSLY